MKTLTQFLTETNTTPKKRKNILTEASKASIGSDADHSYAVKIDALDRNDFYTQIWGRQISDIRKVEEWKKTAKSASVYAKHKPTLASVKQWVKEHNPKEFYAKWKKDSTWYKDDVVDIFYK